MNFLDYQSRVSEIKPTDPLTLFERKYSANDENLWQCEAISAASAREDHIV